MKGVAAYQIYDRASSEISCRRQEPTARHGETTTGQLRLPLLAASGDWSEDDSKSNWCSEMAFTEMLMAVGRVLHDHRDALTPNDLHQCDFPKVGIRCQ
jgi:hypothetical protein